MSLWLLKDQEKMHGQKGFMHNQQQQPLIRHQFVQILFKTKNLKIKNLNSKFEFFWNSENKLDTRTTTGRRATLRTSVYGKRKL